MELQNGDRCDMRCNFLHVCFPEKVTAIRISLGVMGVFRKGGFQIAGKAALQLFFVLLSLMFLGGNTCGGTWPSEALAFFEANVAFDKRPSQ
jgi:hypothetical protein